MSDPQNELHRQIYLISLNKRNIGTKQERYAALYLARAGVQILHRNYRCRMGEIDLIGMDGGTLVFYEVKYRRSSRYDPVAAVDIRKQRRISRVAMYYLVKEYGRTDINCRFDVIGIFADSIHHIRNAFPFRAT